MHNFVVEFVANCKVRRHSKFFNLPNSNFPFNLYVRELLNAEMCKKDMPDATDLRSILQYIIQLSAQIRARIIKFNADDLERLHCTSVTNYFNRSTTLHKTRAGSISAEATV